MQTRPHSARAGFSLIELVVTMTILSILVGIVSFRSGSVVERSKATKIIKLIDELKIACALHHADTGNYAREYTNSSTGNRDLTATQTDAGWEGPYLGAPMTHNNSNPYGNIQLYNVVTAGNWITGFDVDGDGTEEVTGAANMLVLWGMDQEAADRLEVAFDDGVQGTPANTGRVRYTAGSRRAYVLVYH